MSDIQTKGGQARAKALSPSARSAIARAGARARWAKADPSRATLPKAITGLKDRPLQIGDLSIPAYVGPGERMVENVR